MLAGPEGVHRSPGLRDGRHQSVLRFQHVRDLVVEVLTVAVDDRVHHEPFGTTESQALDDHQDPKLLLGGVLGRVLYLCGEAPRLHGSMVPCPEYFGVGSVEYHGTGGGVILDNDWLV